MATLIESCEIEPSFTSELTELSLPFTFLDLPWMYFAPVCDLLFFKFPCSKSDFIETLIPDLKQSLSLTLKHYLPLAGNLLYPLNTTKNRPIIKYVKGDFVSIKFIESTKDFDDLVRNHTRDADQFYDFVPDMPPMKVEAEYKIAHILALQVTLFPNKGVCIGFAINHGIGDMSSIVGFVTSWAFITKVHGDEKFLKLDMPLFDKSVVKDPLRICDTYWDTLKDNIFEPKSFPLPTGRVRATFILDQTHIRKLKLMVMSKYPDLNRLSTFVVSTAYFWRCFVKSGEKVDEDEIFTFAIEARSRIDPPIPENYFGNCFSYGMAKISQSQLVGSEGFVLAAKAIADGIKKRVNNKDGILHGAENWLSDLKTFAGMRSLGVSGSPKFDIYTADFGFGRVCKVEDITIDVRKYAMSLCKSRDFEGGIEVGFSLPKERMEVFRAMFYDGLKMIHDH